MPTACIAALIGHVAVAVAVKVNVKVDVNDVHKRNELPGGCTSGDDASVLVEVSKPACFDYLLVESTGISEPLPDAGPRLGRRTVLTFPLLPPPQKN